MEINNKKIINAWCMYDWANSVYSLVITTAVFPIYYESVTKNIDGSNIVSFFGWELPNTALYSYALSFSFLFTAFLLPFLTGMADYGGKKKMFLKIFAYMGSVACVSLFFFDGQNIEFGILMTIVASIGFSGSLVFYNAFLPEIVTSDRFDRVSARGYSFGYFGSVLLLIFNLVMIQMPHLFGLSEGTIPARISFLLVGVWWAGFSQIPFKILPEIVHNKKGTGNIFIKGYAEILKVYKSLEELPNLKRYLVSFFFYNAGVQAVMYLATLFGSVELKLETSALILIVIIIQIVGIGGSYLFARISEAKGNVFSLVSMLMIWVGVCFTAYLVQTEFQFYALAFVVGLVMGGIQALSRATYTKLIPVNSIDHASYFSFYDITFNISIVMGTFAYGIIDHITGSMRNSALALAFFFIIGLATLLVVKLPSLKKS
ncbi:MAG: MFS transporter [Cyclobacteriaceae bacterium]|nr:MFS transporter [Cyclobacteriaceae bacterium]